MRPNHPYLSDWSSSHNSTKAWTQLTRLVDTLRNPKWWVPLAQGLLVGMLTAGIAFATVITLWKTSNQQTSTATPLQSTDVLTSMYIPSISPCATWDQTGITVAGNSNGTSGSDLGSLSGPAAVFLDTSYTLFVADRSNNRILEYYPNSTSGILVAGNLTAGNSSSQLYSPKGVAVDQMGAVIVADSGNFRIQKFSYGSTVATTVAINSSSNILGQMRDLQIDLNNNIYVTDSDNSRIVMFYPNNGIGVILAGNNGMGSADNQFSSPYANFMDGNTNLYVADYGNHRVQMWAAGATSGETVAGITGSGGTSLMQLLQPYAVIVDNNENIYVADSGNNRIIKWTTNYTAGGVCIVGCTGSVGTAANQLNKPRDLKFDASGNLYVVDQGNNRVQKFAIQLPTSNCSSSG